MKRPIEKLRRFEKLRQLRENAKDLMTDYDMLRGNINCMMVTDDEKELLRMFAFAHKRLGNIFWANQIRIQTDKLEGGNHENND